MRTAVKNGPKKKKKTQTCKTHTTPIKKKEKKETDFE